MCFHFVLCGKLFVAMIVHIVFGLQCYFVQSSVYMALCRKCPLPSTIGSQNSLVPEYCFLCTADKFRVLSCFSATCCVWNMGSEKFTLSEPCERGACFKCENILVKFCHLNRAREIKISVIRSMLLLIRFDATTTNASEV